MSASFARSALLLAVMAGIVPARAADPTVLALTGRIVDATGTPSAVALQSLEFRVYDDAVAGTLRWSEAQAVTVDTGIFYATLGADAGNPLHTQLVRGTTYWLAVKVGADPESPRVRIGAAPLALRARLAEAVPLLSIDGARFQTATLAPVELAPCAVGESIVMGADGWECGSPD